MKYFMKKKKYSGRVIRLEFLSGIYVPVSVDYNLCFLIILRTLSE